jgi:hypothetical protein
MVWQIADQAQPGTKGGEIEIQKINTVNSQAATRKPLFKQSRCVAVHFNCIQSPGAIQQRLRQGAEAGADLYDVIIG